MADRTTHTVTFDNDTITRTSKRIYSCAIICEDQAAYMHPEAGLLAAVAAGVYGYRNDVLKAKAEATKLTITTRMTARVVVFDADHNATA